MGNFKFVDLVGRVSVANISKSWYVETSLLMLLPLVMAAFFVSISTLAHRFDPYYVVSYHLGIDQSETGIMILWVFFGGKISKNWGNKRYHTNSDVLTYCEIQVFAVYSGREWQGNRYLHVIYGRGYKWANHFESVPKYVTVVLCTDHEDLSALFPKLLLGPKPS